MTLDDQQWKEHLAMLKASKKAAQGTLAEVTGSVVPEWFTVSKDDPYQMGHLWGQRHGWDDWEVCLLCMKIRRRDRANGPCKGGSALRDLTPPNDKLRDAGESGVEQH